MHQTINALVLREVNYKEADKILTVLTPELGKITVTARGARRKNSTLAAGTGLLCWSELVIYDFKNQWLVQECAPIRQFSGLALDLERFSLACYCAEVTETLALEDYPAGALLPLMLNTLHGLEQMGDKSPSLIKAAFELRAMCIAGYEPQLDGCVICGCQPEVPRFHLKEGALCCATCRDQLGDGISMPLSVEGLQALRHIVWCDSKKLLAFTLGGAHLRQLASLAEVYVATQLERGFRTLDFYKSLQIGEIE